MSPSFPSSTSLAEAQREPARGAQNWWPSHGASIWCQVARELTSQSSWDIGPGHQRFTPGRCQGMTLTETLGTWTEPLP